LESVNSAVGRGEHFSLIGTVGQARKTKNHLKKRHDKRMVLSTRSKKNNSSVGQQTQAHKVGIKLKSPPPPTPQTLLGRNDKHKCPVWKGGGRTNKKNGKDLFKGKRVKKTPHANSKFGETHRKAKLPDTKKPRVKVKKRRGTPDIPRGKKYVSLGGGNGVTFSSRGRTFQKRTSGREKRGG